MSNNITPRPPVAAGCGRVNPQDLDLARILDLLDVIKPRVENLLPRKHSGYPYVVFVLLQACIQLAGGAVKATIERLNQSCRSMGKSFQAYRAELFSNKKRRRFFPDQPSLSRCLRRLSTLGLVEVFWNEVNFAHLLLLKQHGLVRPDINLIADYKETSCPKDVDDPYCFGTKEGETVHKTLVFSIKSGNLHQVVFAYKIAKQQHKLPLFSETVRRLKGAGLVIKHVMLDRGFYRKALLVAFKRWGITVIMPGRQCSETRAMIVDYLTGKGKRSGVGHMKLGYVRGQGSVYLEFDIVLCAKRSWKLDKIKADYKNGKLSLDDAAARVFPLIVLIANNRGITKVYGNESRIRMLYRARWNIEIAFREMNRLGLTSRSQHRDGRLAAMGARIFIYNIWQVERYLLKVDDPDAPPLELNEFLGRGCVPRQVRYAKNVGMI